VVTIKDISDEDIMPFVEELKYLGENLTAVSLEMFDIAWTKYLNSKRVGLMTNVDFKTKKLAPIEEKMPRIKDVEGLRFAYNQAFGSSYTDGNTEMAYAMGYDLGGTPTTEALQGFIAYIGPAKVLQENIELVQERLATEADAVNVAADWAKRSGCLKPCNEILEEHL